MKPAIDPVALRRKIAWRVLPFVFLLYIVAYLDRANAGFAKLGCRSIGRPAVAGSSLSR